MAMFRFAGLLGLFSLMIGCSGGSVIAPVKGKISYMGKIIDQGIIMFLPEQGPAATANIEKLNRWRRPGPVDVADIPTYARSLRIV